VLHEHITISKVWFDRYSMTARNNAIMDFKPKSVESIAVVN